jgi:hypothetical protein
LQLIAVSETRHTNRLVGLDGFMVIRADRGGGRRGGGVALYLRDNLRYMDRWILEGALHAGHELGLMC